MPNVLAIILARRNSKGLLRKNVLDVSDFRHFRINHFKLFRDTLLISYHPKTARECDPKVLSRSHTK
jgi:CMP-N-acetylneuraminic acid synthetase